MDFLKDQDIQRYLKRALFVIGGFLVLAFILIFIFQENHRIVLKKQEVAYQSQVNIVDLVESIGQTKIQHQQTVSSNTIVLEKYEVSFDEIDTSKLGKQTIRATFSDETIEPQELEILVKDTKKPTIHFLIEKDTELELKKVKDKEFSDLFEVKDNHTKADEMKVKVTVEPKEVDYGDSFTLTVKATDVSKNTTTSKIRLKVKEKKPDPPKKETKNDSHSNSSQGNTTVQPTVPQQSSGTQQSQQSQSQQPVNPPVQQKPSNKRYMFSDGYDMSSAPQACQNDLFASSFAGACVPIQDANGIYIGMELQFY